MKRLPRRFAPRNDAPMAVISFLVLAGCSHVSQVKPTGLKAEDFWRDQTARVLETESISGKVLVHYEGKKNSISGKAKFSSHTPDVRFEIKDPIGRTQCVLVLEGNLLTAYYPGEKKAYLDENSGQAYMKKFLGMSLSVRDLQGLMLGMIPGKTKSFDSWEWDAERGLYRGEAAGKSGKLIAFVDPVRASLKEVKYEFPNELVRIAYDDFTSCCRETSSTSVAQVVSVNMEKAKTKLQLEWEEVLFDKKLNGLGISLPQDVEKISLK